MTKIIVIAALGFIILLSVVISGIAHKRHKAEELRLLKIKRAQKTAAEIEQVFKSLLPVALKHSIYQLLGQYWTDVLNEALTLSKGNSEFRSSLDKAQQLIDKALNTEEHSSPATTPSAVKSYQHAVTLALNMIRKLPKLGYLSSAQLSDIELYMKQQYAEVEIYSHLQSARMFIKKGDRSSGRTHFRYAQNKLLQSKVHGPEKKEWVTAIGEESKLLLEEKEVAQEQQTTSTPQVETKAEKPPVKRDAVSQFLNMDPNKKRIG